MTGLRGRVVELLRGRLIGLRSCEQLYDWREAGCLLQGFEPLRDRRQCEAGWLLMRSHEQVRVSWRCAAGRLLLGCEQVRDQWRCEAG